MDGKTFFLDSNDTSSMTKSADNCKLLCKNSIKTGKKKFNCTVMSVMTDNPKNMERMRLMRASLCEDDMGMLIYGCLTHWLNLLLSSRSGYYTIFCNDACH